MVLGESNYVCGAYLFWIYLELKGLFESRWFLRNASPGTGWPKSSMYRKRYMASFSSSTDQQLNQTQDTDNQRHEMRRGYIQLNSIYLQIEFKLMHTLYILMHYTVLFRTHALSSFPSFPPSFPPPFSHLGSRVSNEQQQWQACGLHSFSVLLQSPCWD